MTTTTGAGRRPRALAVHLLALALAAVIGAVVLTSCAMGPVSFTADRTGGPDPLIVRFTDTTTSSAAWQWDFGDGGTSTAQHPIHTYLTPGTYTVSLTATGLDQTVATATRTALITVTPTVNPPLQGSFGEFVAYCPFTHRATNDPIVFPGQTGASHRHDFFGNTTTDASSTTESLLAGGTTCDPVADRASYWVPTMFANGVPVEVEQATFYYNNENVEAGAVRPPPTGLKMLTGSPGRQTADGTASHYVWSCLGNTGPSTSGGFTDCGPGGRIELILDYPSCWNGTDLDSADHRSHLAFAQQDRCPASHPVPLARLQFKLRWNHRGGAGTTLASGTGWSAHADFFNAWDPGELERRVVDCLHVRIKCGPDGRPA
jgi:PKD repeat protein